jgi:hypothetical protein
VNEDGVNVLGTPGEERGNYIKHKLDAPERWLLSVDKQAATAARTRVRDGTC